MTGTLDIAAFHTLPTGQQVQWIAHARNCRSGTYEPVVRKRDTPPSVDDAVAQHIASMKEG